MTISIRRAVCRHTKTHKSRKFAPGHFIKIEDYELLVPANMTAIRDVLIDTPALAGAKIFVMWGRHDTESQLQALDALIETIKSSGKLVMLGYGWKEFQAINKGASRVLPTRLASSPGSYDDPVNTLDHVIYDNLWAYKQGVRVVGYNFKLGKASFDAENLDYIDRLGARYDKDPRIVQISTTETASTTPVIPFGTGSNSDISLNGYLAGQRTCMRRLKTAFKNTPICPDVNYPDNQLAEFSANMAVQEGFAFGTSNCNLKSSLNDADGVLTRMIAHGDSIFSAPEVQGDDYVNTHGNDPNAVGAAPDPSIRWLYHRCRDYLQAHNIVWQYNNNDKIDHVGTLSYREDVINFLRTYPLIVSDPRGIGGLNPRRPRVLL